MLNYEYNSSESFFRACHALGVDGHYLIGAGYYVRRSNGHIVSAEYLNNQY